MTSRNCPGLHCRSCGTTGISAGTIAVIIAAGVLIADGQAIGHAIADVVRIAVITVAALAGLALLAAIIAAIIWVRRRVSARRPVLTSVTRANPVIVIPASVLPRTGRQPDAITTAFILNSRPAHGQPAPVRRWPS